MPNVGKGKCLALYNAYSGFGFLRRVPLAGRIFPQVSERHSTDEEGAETVIPLVEDGTDYGKIK